MERKWIEYRIALQTQFENFMQRAGGISNHFTDGVNTLLAKCARKAVNKYFQAQ